MSEIYFYEVEEPPAENRSAAWNFIAAVNGVLVTQPGARYAIYAGVIGALLCGACFLVVLCTQCLRAPGYRTLVNPPAPARGASGDAKKTE